MSRGRWQLAAWTALLVVTAISFITVPPLPEAAPVWSDKVAHAVLYGGLMQLFARGYALPPARASRTAAAILVLLAIFLTLWGCAIEWLQGLSAHRSASAADALANITGIIIALVLLPRGGTTPD